jgi:hypothetical protein
VQGAVAALPHGVHITPGRQQLLHHTCQRSTHPTPGTATAAQQRQQGVYVLCYVYVDAPGRQ